MSNPLRNITIGLTDGLTVPFAFAAGLSTVLHSSRTIFVSCLAIVVASALTMTAGAYQSARKQAGHRAWVPALLIGAGYAGGGLLSVCPFLFMDSPAAAFTAASVITFPCLALAGYADSHMHQANGWAGALRVTFTGALAAAAAWAVALLFR